MTGREKAERRQSAPGVKEDYFGRECKFQNSWGSSVEVPRHVYTWLIRHVPTADWIIPEERAPPSLPHVYLLFIISARQKGIGTFSAPNHSFQTAILNTGRPWTFVAGFKMWQAKNVFHMLIYAVSGSQIFVYFHKSGNNYTNSVKKLSCDLSTIYELQEQHSNLTGTVLHR